MSDLDKWLEEKGERASPRDVSKRVGSVYNEIQRMCQRQTQSLKAHNFSPYHKDDAARAIQWREEAEEKLATTLSRFEP